MFPTSLEHPYQPARGRRRGRNQPNNRDYICPCGKSYLSYPALFTHIKIKHNGRAPGQVIKPRSEYASRRGRPKQKEVYDSDSDTQDIASNCIDRLCDFVTDVERWDDDGCLKEVYMKSEFYGLYVDFNPQEQEPKYDQNQEIYDQTCANVFCELLAEISKRNQPYHFDMLFVLFIMLSRAIEEEAQAHRGDDEDEQEQEQNSSDDKPHKHLKVEIEPVSSLINVINPFMLTYITKYREQYELDKMSLFNNKNIAQLIELFFNWLTNKKYLAHKIRINENYNF